MVVQLDVTGVIWHRLWLGFKPMSFVSFKNLS
jgi:hypothetical protein